MEEAQEVAPLPIAMMDDRLLVSTDVELGERRSGGGILIPATVQLGRRLRWAKVVAVGPNIRNISVEDRVLFDPEGRGEVELQQKTYIVLRERDIHAVAAKELDSSPSGLYL